MNRLIIIFRYHLERRADVEGTSVLQIVKIGSDLIYSGTRCVLAPVDQTKTHERMTSSPLLHRNVPSQASLPRHRHNAGTTSPTSLSTFPQTSSNVKKEHGRMV